MANNDNNRQFSRNKPTHKPLFDTGGRIPPHDKDVEEAVLGALMLEKDAYPTVCPHAAPRSAPPTGAPSPSSCGPTAPSTR